MDSCNPKRNIFLLYFYGLRFRMILENRTILSFVFRYCVYVETAAPHMKSIARFFSDGIIKLTVFTIVIIILFELLWHFADSYRVKHYSSCPKELFQKILLILKNAGLTEEVVLQWLVSIK